MEFLQLALLVVSSVAVDAMPEFRRGILPPKHESVVGPLIQPGYQGEAVEYQNNSQADHASQEPESGVFLPTNRLEDISNNHISSQSPVHLSDAGNDSEEKVEVIVPTEILPHLVMSGESHIMSRIIKRIYKLTGEAKIKSVIIDVNSRHTR